MGRLLPSLQDALAAAVAQNSRDTAVDTPAASSANSAPSPATLAMPARVPSLAPAEPAGDEVDEYADMPGLIRPPEADDWPDDNLQTRAPSPPPPPADEPTSGWGWDPSDTGGWGGLQPQPHWSYDAHPDHNNWNASAAGHGAALLLNAAYSRSVQLAPLDMRWHRPDDREASPFGNNQRGDIAPNVVHATLDDVLAAHTPNPLEIQLLHCWIDGVWMRHSRCQERCVEAVRRLDYFNDGEVAILGTAIHSEPLTDFRVVMHSIDPRPRPVYGRTQDSEGTSRLFRMFPVTLTRPDRATWDEDDGDLTGSSREASDDERPFRRTEQQRIERRRRHLERRARHALPAIESAEREMNEIERRLYDVRGNIPGARALVDIIRRGMNAPVGSEQRQAIWQGWA